MPDLLRNSLSLSKRIYPFPKGVSKGYKNNLKPNDSSSLSISTGTDSATFVLPNSGRISSLAFRCNHSVALGSGFINAVLTITPVNLPTAGTYHFVFQDPYTGKTSMSASLDYDATAADQKAAIEAMESFRGTITASATLSASASTYTFSGEYSAMPIPYTALTAYANDGGDSSTFVTTVTTTGSGGCLDRSIFPIFKNLIVTVGSSVYTIQEVGLWARRRILRTLSKTQQSVLGPPMGIDRLDRNFLRAQSGFSYEVPLRYLSDLFEHVLPTDRMSKTTWQLEFQFETAAKSHYANADSSLTYTLSNMQLEYVVLNEDNPPTGGSQLPFNYVNYERNIGTSNASSFNLKLNSNTKSCNAYEFTLRDQSIVSSLSTQGKMDKFAFSSLTDFQFDLNGVNYPSNVIDATDGVEPYKHMISDNQLWQLPNFDIEQFYNQDSVTGNQESLESQTPGGSGGSKAIFRFSFAPKFKTFFYPQKMVIGGGANLYSSSGNNSCIINKNSVATTYQIDSFTESDCVLIIDGAKVRIDK